MRHNKKKNLWISSFGLLVFLHICVFTAYRISKNEDSSDTIPEAKFEPTLPPKMLPVQLPSSFSPARVIYPHSIIRGGVQTAEEFREALLKDRVVAAHFSNFDARTTRVVELKTQKAAYVSYRINDRVFWTKKKVALAKGEKLITDGVNYARARCGNRISEVSQTPISSEEPSHAFLDRPIPTDEKRDDKEDTSLAAAFPKPAASFPGQSHPSAFTTMADPGSRRPGLVIPAIVGGGALAGRAFGPNGGSRNQPSAPTTAVSGSVPPAPPTVVSGPAPLPAANVPEPQTLLFVSAGLSFFWTFRKRFRR